MTLPRERVRLHANTGGVMKIMKSHDFLLVPPSPLCPLLTVVMRADVALLCVVEQRMADYRHRQLDELRAIAERRDERQDR